MVKGWRRMGEDGFGGGGGGGEGGGGRNSRHGRRHTAREGGMNDNE